MKRIAATLVVHLLALACAPLASADVFNMPGGLKSLSFVAIGDAGNAHDPATGGVFGGVADNYAIGKFDVTTAQYAQFLNAVAATDTYELYSPSMGTYFGSSGVSRSGSSGSYSYSVIGNGDTPIFDVSWGDAARFVNWIENQGNRTSPSRWSKDCVMSVSVNPTRGRRGVVRHGGDSWQPVPAR